MKKDPFAWQGVPLPKIPWCTFVTACTEIHTRICKHSLSEEQSWLGAVSLFMDLHDFISLSS